MDKIVTSDPAQPGVFKVNGPVLQAGGKILLSDLDTSGAINGDEIVLVGGVWTPTTPTPVTPDTASNLGAGNGVFSSKVANDFQFKSLIAGANITITPTATDLTFAASFAGAFTENYTSPLQVITSGGPLTLAHGLSSDPTLLQVEVECVANDAATGFVTGDKCFYITQDANSGNPGYGMSVISDATNLYIQFGSAPSPISLLNKTTGVGGSPTLNGNFQVRFRAWR